VAQFDRFTATIVQQYQTVTMNNIFHWQIVDEQDPDTALSDLATFMANFVSTTWAANFVADCVATQIVVRRLKPAITDVLVNDINVMGGVPQDGLPSTVYAKLDYYCLPFEKGQHNHFKLSGLPMDANQRGNFTDEAVVRIQNLINIITQSPWVSGNNGYALTRPVKETDLAGVALPIVYKAFPDTILRNWRPRQSY
jgi:hypothetical protein